MDLKDFSNNLELIKGNILSNTEEYIKLLKVIGNNQKYDFISQLSIYNKNPNALACAEFDYWRENFNRSVRAGQKGIPVLSSNGLKVSYIFDISQTVSKDKANTKLDIEDIELWQFENYNHIEKMLENNGLLQR